MDLGQLLKQARLESGLSQRQLCGGQITRNMLSQIENGSARPSMDTLRYLAARLGKPISFFLEESAASPNQACIQQAREAWSQGDPAAALQVLEGYAADGIFDAEAGLLQVLCCLSLAEDALNQGHIPYAHTLLQKAVSDSPYYTADLARRRLLLLARVNPESCSEIVQQLPDDELLLRATAACQTGDHARCAALLDSAADLSSPEWNILRGDVCFALEDYTQARTYYLQAEDQSLHKLEKCCEKLGDYKMAYYYACKQR